MRKEQFITSLKEICPSNEELKSQGLSIEYIETLRRSFDISDLNQDSKLVTNNSDELLNLALTYDLRNIEIGCIQFTNPYSNDVREYIIGKVEMDHLIYTPNKGYLVKDGYNNTTLWECAINGEKFLDALIEAQMFLTARLLNDDLWDDLEKTKECAEICSSKAGGKKYLDFYRMMLGI